MPIHIYIYVYVSVCGEVTTTIRLVNTSITSHNYISFFFLLVVVKTFKTYSLGNFEVHNTVLQYW